MHYFVKIRKTNYKGRGVFATHAFKKGDIIEKCPVIVLSKKEDFHIQKTILGKYVYEWQEKLAAIVLGYGSVYNHSFTPNATYQRDFARKTMTYLAYTNIARGEEIIVNYNGHPKSLKQVEDFVPVKE